MAENLGQLLNRCSYVDAPRVNNDVEEAILNYGALKFRQGTETGNPGVVIIILTGTVPVSIQGATYHFPIEVTLPSLYPIVKPDIVLKPTSAMTIDPRHPHVDQSGTVTTPYLDAWVPEDHTILFALMDMIELFSRQSPLHSRAPAATATTTTTTTTTTTSSSSTFSPSYIGFRSSPTSSPMATQRSPYPGATSTTTTTTTTSYPYGGNPNTPYSPYGSGNGVAGTSAYPPSSSPYGRPPAQSPYQSPYQQQNQQQAPGEDRQALVEGRRRVKEELEVRAQSIFSDTAELEARLREIEEETKRGEAGKARAEAGLEKARADVAAAEKEGAELAAWVEEHERSLEDLTPARVDELTQAEDALERQLADVTAVDGAISDLLYALDKALREGAVEFDVYLRLVRKYAAEQYNARALAEKIKRALYY